MDLCTDDTVRPEIPRSALLHEARAAWARTGERVSPHPRSKLTLNSYSLNDDQSFAEGLHSSTMDMAGDEGRAQGAQKASQMKWDRKKKKFTSSTQVGADNKKLIRSESGALLPATYNSGRYREWRSQRNRSSASKEFSQSGSEKRHQTSEILPARAIYQKRQDKEKVSHTTWTSADL